VRRRFCGRNFGQENELQGDHRLGAAGLIGGKRAKPARQEYWQDDNITIWQHPRQRLAKPSGIGQTMS